MPSRWGDLQACFETDSFDVKFVNASLGIQARARGRGKPQISSATCPLTHLLHATSGASENYNVLRDEYTS